MELRKLRSYKDQLIIIRYALRGDEYKSSSVAAVALAIADKKNVILKPDCRVFIHGQIGITPNSSPGGKAFETMNTSYIEAIYFEKVFEGDLVNFHCYVKTEDNIYRLWDNDKTRMVDLQFLLEDLEERELGFDDFRDYFVEINTDYKEVRIIP